MTKEFGTFLPTNRLFGEVMKRTEAKSWHLRTKKSEKDTAILLFFGTFAHKTLTSRQPLPDVLSKTIRQNMGTPNKFTELSEKPIGILLLQYSIPAIIAMAASSVYNIIDGIFIGQGVGEEAIMGLALTTPLMNLTAAFGAMVGVGGSTLMSVRLGQKDYNSARKILGNVLIMNVTLGVALGLILLIFLSPILRFFGASDATLPYAYDFMAILLGGNVITHLYLGLNAQLRSTNRPKIAMYATFGTVGINLILAPLFIFVFGMGIRGAAFATLMGQLAMLCWQLKLFRKPEDIIRIERRIIKPDFGIMRESLLIGTPQFLVNSCACLVSIVITRSMAEYGGDIAVGAFGICNRLIMLMVFIVIGLNQGMQPIAGYNYGAMHYDRLLRVVNYTIIGATVITTTGFLVGEFAATPCVSVFAKDAPELIEAAAHGLRITVMVFPLVGMQIVSGTFFQSIGFPAKSIFLSLTRQMIFLLPGLFILPHLFTSNPTDGVWYAMPVSDLAAAILSAILLVKEFKKLKAATPSQPL